MLIRESSTITCKNLSLFLSILLCDVLFVVYGQQWMSYRSRNIYQYKLRRQLEILIYIYRFSFTLIPLFNIYIIQFLLLDNGRYTFKREKDQRWRLCIWFISNRLCSLYWFIRRPLYVNKVKNTFCGHVLTHQSPLSLPTFATFSKQLLRWFQARVLFIFLIFILPSLWV